MRERKGMREEKGMESVQRTCEFTRHVTSHQNLHCLVGVGWEQEIRWNRRRKVCKRTCV